MQHAISCMIKLCLPAVPTFSRLNPLEIWDRSSEQTRL
jgi:hypothetical protein